MVINYIVYSIVCDNSSFQNPLCNKYIPINITIIGYEEVNIIGKYVNFLEPCNF